MNPGTGGLDIRTLKRGTLLLIVAIVIAACGGTPPATPSAAVAAPPTSGPSLTPILPSPTTSDAPAPSPAPTAMPAPTPQPPGVTYPAELDYANQFLMRVDVAGLNVRAKPSTSGASLGRAAKGSVFIVRDWPIQANGFAWYFGYQSAIAANGAVPALPNAIDYATNGQGGWLAAGTATTPYLIPIAPRCPTTVNLANVESMLDSEQLACFGSKAIVLQGTIGCGGCGGVSAGTDTPDWLADALSGDLLSGHPETRLGPLAVHFAPTGPPRPADGSIVKLTTHLNDPRASTCRISVVDDAGNDVAVDNAAALAWCNAKFVVDSLDVLGTDPSFPLG